MIKKITQISCGGTHAICPYCRKSFKLQRGLKLPRHGFRFEAGHHYPQHERGNTQYGCCSGSGLEVPREILQQK